MFIPWVDLNHRHPLLDLCERGSDRKRRHLVEEEAWVWAVTVLWSYGHTVETVFSFKYFVRLLTLADKYCPAIISNLWNTRKSQSWLSQIFGQEGADTRALGHLYVDIVQAVFLFVLETWVVTPHIRRILGGFHHKVAQRLSGHFSRW